MSVLCGSVNARVPSYRLRTYDSFRQADADAAAVCSIVPVRVADRTGEETAFVKLRRTFRRRLRVS